MAGVAARLPALEDLLQLLPPLRGRRDLGRDGRGPAGRKKLGRESTPSGACIDSQSAKTASGGVEVGVDGGKMVRGRNRHIVTDTQGSLLIVGVTAANVDDGATAPRLLAGPPAASFPRLSVVRADREYRNRKLDERLAGRDRLRLEISWKPDGEEGFKPLKKRWVVEQAFGCLLRWRRLVRDFERLPSTSAAMVKISAIHRMVRRARPPRGRKKYRYKRPPKAAA